MYQVMDYQSPRPRPFDVLEPHGKTVHFQAGQQLFAEGDRAEGFWLLRTGSVRLYSLGENLREAEIHRCEAGDIVAAALALARMPFPHFGQALEDCEALYFSTETALPLIAGHPPLALLFLRILSGKCSELSARVSALQMQSVRDRLLYYLGEQCPSDGACSFRLPLAKKEVAQLLGTTPETLSRTFHTLQEEGVLTLSNRNVVLHQCIRKDRCAGRKHQSP